jgi:hypothetical protein
MLDTIITFLATYSTIPRSLEPQKPLKESSLHPWCCTVNHKRNAKAMTRAQTEQELTRCNANY